MLMAKERLHDSSKGGKTCVLETLRFNENVRKRNTNLYAVKNRARPNTLTTHHKRRVTLLITAHTAHTV